ncbi:MAG: DUF4175 family protein [Rhodospirillales bacterium]|nr:DUF4175 family protein [Rhodospirillales bacterium]MCB9995875.1 DUF4175 family protein [Rhodospirillales bacterium]
MLDPLDFEQRPLYTRIARKRAITGLVLRIENATSALWRIGSWLALFAGLWLLQIPDVAGTFGPVLFFLLFTVGLAWLVREDLPKLRRPAPREIDRRLEEISALHHRPLSALQDKLVNPRIDPTRKLWQQNQQDALEKLGALRLPPPRPLLAKHDPLALRFAAILLLIGGLVIAGPQWESRIIHGLTPFSFRGETHGPSPMTLWVTPPEYTGMPQLTLQGTGRRDEPIAIPAGSVVKIRINDGFTQPRLMMGEDELLLEALGDKSWGLETEIKPGERLVLKQWPMTRADIAYQYVPDTPPTLTLNGAPETMTKGEIRIPLKALDDYGVTDLAMSMDLSEDIEDHPLGSAYRESRAVMSPPGQETDLTPVYDLSWHPWAGLPVVIALEGVDHLGQKSILPPLHVTLPERTFQHPVAQALVEYRKRLIWTPENAAGNVAYDIEQILMEPGLYQNDLIVTLALRSAASRLGYDPSQESVVTVIELLWDTALRIEEGDLPMAARNMQEAQRRLEQVLKDPNASDEEIAQALQDLREAMAEYLQEMYREMQKRMAENGKQMQIPPEMFQNMINPEDMASFLDQLQSEALSGNKDSARELLSQLQQFMDMFDPSMDMAMPPQMEFMMEGMNELQELIEKQQALLDQTREKTQGQQLEQEYPDFSPFDNELLDDWVMDMPPPPKDPPKQKPQDDVDTQEHKVEQDALRYILGQLMLETDEKMGEIPENMQKAEIEMRNSADALGENQPMQSVPHQEQALEHLQQAMKDMSQQLQQMMQQMTLMSFGGASRLDPLGRPMQDGDGGSPFPGSRVEIPDEGERKRVQEILKTLRQRSGEVDRPDYELEYYRRLMKQF